QAPSGQAPSGQAPSSLTGAAGTQTTTEWPKVIKAGAATISVYLPQLDSWDGSRLEAHSAISITPSDNDPPVVGVLVVIWDTQGDKGARPVTLDGLRIARVKFPSAPDKEAPYKKLLEQHVPKRVRTIELDRLEAALATAEAREKVEKKPLRNDPP